MKKKKTVRKNKKSRYIYEQVLSCFKSPKKVYSTRQILKSARKYGLSDRQIYDGISYLYRVAGAIKRVHHSCYVKR